MRINRKGLNVNRTDIRVSFSISRERPVINPYQFSREKRKLYPFHRKYVVAFNHRAPVRKKERKENYARTEKFDETETRRSRRVRIGPWRHIPLREFRKTRIGFPRKLGERKNEGKVCSKPSHGPNDLFPQFFSFSRVLSRASKYLANITKPKIFSPPVN